MLTIYVTLNYLKLTKYVNIMVTINKPKGITITLRDRAENRSKSITVYGVSLEELEKKIEKVLHVDLK